MALERSLKTIVVEGKYDRLEVKDGHDQQRCSSKNGTANEPTRITIAYPPYVGRGMYKNGQIVSSCHYCASRDLNRASQVMSSGLRVSIWYTIRKGF